MSNGPTMTPLARTLIGGLTVAFILGGITLARGQSTLAVKVERNQSEIAHQRIAAEAVPVIQSDIRHIKDDLEDVKDDVDEIKQGIAEIKAAVAR